MSPTFGKATTLPAAASSSRRQQRCSPDPSEQSVACPLLRPQSPGIQKLPRSPRRTVRSKSSVSHHELCYSAGRRQRRECIDADDVEDKRKSHVKNLKPSATVGTQTDPVCEHGIPFTSLVSDLVQASRPSPCEPSDNRFLEKLAKIQGELAMAVCSGMELIAERGAMSASSDSPIICGAAGVVQTANAEVLLTCAAVDVGEGGAGAHGAGEAGVDTAVEFAAYGSDSECDEVRSLSLSEDGPVYSRIYHWRDSMRAPDPIAMISDGQHSALDGEESEEDELERSVGSGTSAATTRLAIDGVCARGTREHKLAATSQEDALSELLSPILSKITNRLEILPELDAGWMEAPPQVDRAAAPRPVQRVQATKVKAVRSVDDALPLSLVRSHPRTCRLAVARHRQPSFPHIAPLTRPRPRPALPRWTSTWTRGTASAA